MSISKFKKITSEDIEEYNFVKSKLENIQNQINERIAYIIHFISQELNYKCKSWYFWQNDYYHDNTIKDWFFDKENDISGFSIEPTKGSDGQYCFYASFKDDTEYLVDWNADHRRSFPKRWIFEDFEEEFKAGRLKFLKEFDSEQTIKNEKKIQKLKEKQEKIKKSLSKLQEEENKLTSRFVKVGPHQFASENK